MKLKYLFVLALVGFILSINLPDCNNSYDDHSEITNSSVSVSEHETITGEYIFNLIEDDDQDKCKKLTHRTITHENIVNKKIYIFIINQAENFPKWLNDSYYLIDIPPPVLG